MTLRFLWRAAAAAVLALLCVLAWRGWTAPGSAADWPWLWALCGG